jgi:hypothetical protein
MTSSMAERFMQALQAAEESGQVAGLVELFGEGAELKRQSGEAHAGGADSAERFWNGSRTPSP